MKGKYFIVPLDIYRHDVWFSIGQTDKDFLKSINEGLPDEFMVDLKDDSISHMDESCNGRTWHHLIGGQTVIRLREAPKTAQQLGTLSHEIFHAVDYIFRRIGISLSEQSEEAYAYAIGYVTEQFWNNIKK